MFEKVRQILEELNSILSKGIKGYKVNFFALIATFILLNTLNAIMLNIHMGSRNLKNRYEMSIYFKGEPSEDVLMEFEKRLLSMDEVRRISYESKEIALRELEGELGIRIPRGNNPLSNNFLVNFYGNKDLETLQLKLEEEEIIKEIYMNEEQLERLTKNLNRNSKIQLSILLGGYLPLILIIFSFFHSNILNYKKEINSKMYLGENKMTVVRPYFFMSECIFGISATLGTLVFLNLYKIFRYNFKEIGLENSLASTPEMAIASILVTLIVMIVFPLVSYLVYKVDGE